MISVTPTGPALKYLDMLPALSVMLTGSLRGYRLPPEATDTPRSFTDIMGWVQISLMPPRSSQTVMHLREGTTISWAAGVNTRESTTEDRVQQVASATETAWEDT